MDDPTAILEAAHALAAAIARRDATGVRTFLAPDFELRAPGGASVDGAAFAAGIQQIPGDIRFVKLLDVRVELLGRRALVTGVQHASIVLNGDEVADRRPFVDLFARGEDGVWRVQLALDLPPFA